MFSLSRQLPCFDVIEYIVHLIQRLSYLCNYCLLGNSVDNGQFLAQTLSPPYWMKTVSLALNGLDSVHWCYSCLDQCQRA